MKKKETNINRKKGSALAETLLIIAVSLVLVIVIFYPQISSLFQNLMTSIATWFNKAISMMGIS